MASDNGFDFENLRLTQDFSALVGGKKLLTTVPVRRPNRQEFIRVNADESWRFQTAVLDLREERETYLVDQTLWQTLAGELVPKMLFTTQNRQGVTFLWPIHLPGPDGRLDPWSHSALTAAYTAMTAWVRVCANQALGGYEIFSSELHDEPTWPDLTFRELLRIAFKDRHIQALDHPVLKRLRGEI